MVRTCTQCGLSKSPDDFYMACTGVPMAACKECHKKSVRANRANRAEQYAKYERTRANDPSRVNARLEYARTAGGKDAHIRANREYRRRSPLKASAHRKVALALKKNLLTRQPCEVCGDARSQAHHDDYGKPLEVRWLCGPHHAEWHRHNTPIYPDKEQAA